MRAIREEFVEISGLRIGVRLLDGEKNACIELTLPSLAESACVDAGSLEEALRLLPVAVAAFADSALRRHTGPVRRASSVLSC